MKRKKAVPREHCVDALAFHFLDLKWRDHSWLQRRQSCRRDCREAGLLEVVLNVQANAQWFSDFNSGLGGTKGVGGRTST